YTPRRARGCSSPSFCRVIWYGQYQEAAMPVVYCPECRKPASEQATACPHCGYHFLLPPQPPPLSADHEGLLRSRERGMAALLSLLIPGAGQIYKGHVKRGILWLVCVVVGYKLRVLPGLLLHLLCILNAGKKAR